MLFLIGVNHNAQHMGPCLDIRGAKVLDRQINRLCEENNIEIIAEEFSEDACRNWQSKESIGSANARDRNILHIYCDPIEKERAMIGIPIQKELETRVKSALGVESMNSEEAALRYDRLAAEHYAKRERFWLDKIAPYRSNSVLFICGSAHVQSFSTLLEANNWQVTLIE